MPTTVLGRLHSEVCASWQGPRPAHRLRHRRRPKSEEHSFCSCRQLQVSWAGRQGRVSSVAADVQPLAQPSSPATAKPSQQSIPKHWEDQMSKAPMGKRRVLQRYCEKVAVINAWEPRTMALTDEQLRGKTAEFKERLQRGETLDDLLPEAFAVVRETSRRVLGLRHFDSQLVGGMVLHEGQIAEMATGEGKTLMATLPVYLNALPGRGVHVVTVNDYLAGRDAAWMGKVYSALGMTSAAVASNMSTAQYQAAYKADITYVTGQELCFDYLRDNTAQSASELMVPEQLPFAVVDEVDSILIDESRNPMIISAPVALGEGVVRQVDGAVRELLDSITASYKRVKASLGYPEDAEVKRLEEGEKARLLVVDKKQKNLSLTHEGSQLLFINLLNQGVVFERSRRENRPPDVMDMWEDDVPWGHLALNALKAYEFYKAGQQYIVREGKVVIVDESTGRVRPISRYQGGIHQALEAKEGVAIRRETFATSSITFQVFFRFYEKLAGMTGTAQTAAAEFYEIYGLRVVQIPTAKPSVRVDVPPILYLSRLDKYRQLAAAVQRCWEIDRPVLMGTTSVTESEEVRRALALFTSKEYAWHVQSKVQVLNAKPESVRQEAQIIAQAGLPGTVTIATNMAGRGTDIILGGSPEGLARLALMRLVYKRLLQAPGEEEGIPRMPLPVFSAYEALGRMQPLEWTAEAAEAGRLLPRDLHFILYQAMVMTDVGGEERRIRSYDELTKLAAQAMEVAEKLRREVVVRLRAQRQGSAVEDLDYSVVVSPVARQVLLDLEELYVKEPPGQQFAIKALLCLWLWFDQECARSAARVRAAGGLLVIGTSVQESKRIELQLRGRAGRQGDPGETWMLYDVEDSLLSTFGVASLQRMAGMGGSAGLYIEGMPVELVVKEVQRVIENMWQMSRLETKRYDEVMEEYRRNLHAIRRLILQGSPAQRSQLLYMFFQQWVDQQAGALLDSSKPPARWCTDAVELGTFVTTRYAPSFQVVTTGCMSPLQALMWRLNHLVNPEGVVSKTAIEFKTVKEGVVRDSTINSLLQMLGAIKPGEELERPAPGEDRDDTAPSTSGQGQDAGKSRRKPSARLPVQILEVPFLTPDQIRNIADFLLTDAPLTWPSPRVPLTIRLKAAVARHRRLFPSDEGGGAGGRSREDEGAGLGAFRVSRPELKGRHAGKLAALRGYLGEALIYAYELRKAGLKKMLMGQQLGLLDMDADIHLAMYEQHCMLEWMDALWSSFMEETDRMRRAVQVKSFANTSPLEEFRIEANRAFLAMLDTYRDAVVEKVFAPSFDVDIFENAEESGILAPLLPETVGPSGNGNGGNGGGRQDASALPQQHGAFNGSGDPPQAGNGSSGSGSLKLGRQQAGQTTRRQGAG